MSPLAHSLHVAVAAPATTPTVWQPDLSRESPKKALSVSYLARCQLTIDTTRGQCKNSRAIGFNFLCFPPRAAIFHLESTAERSIARRKIRLFAFPHQLGWGITGPCSTDFALAEYLVE